MRKIFLILNLVWIYYSIVWFLAFAVTIVFNISGLFSKIFEILTFPEILSSIPYVVSTLLLLLIDQLFHLTNETVLAEIVVLVVNFICIFIPTILYFIITSLLRKRG